MLRREDRDIAIVIVEGLPHASWKEGMKGEQGELLFQIRCFSKTGQKLYKEVKPGSKACITFLASVVLG